MNLKTGNYTFDGNCNIYVNYNSRREKLNILPKAFRNISNNTRSIFY